MSTVLNTLDGVQSPHALVFIMTTNHMDQLPPALIRRCAVSVHVDHPGDDEIRAMVTRMYEGGTAQGPLPSAHQVEAFVAAVHNLRARPSMARLQNLCLRFRQDIAAATEAMPVLDEPFDM